MFIHSNNVETAEQHYPKVEVSDTTMLNKDLLLV